MSKTGELFGTFFKIGAFTFGGGYAMVALLEHEFVEKKRWLTREEFLDMVAIAESTPGPVAVNSATYIGYKIDFPYRNLSLFLLLIHYLCLAFRMLLHTHLPN